jgi:hypothetical protein
MIKDMCILAHSYSGCIKVLERHAGNQIHSWIPEKKNSRLEGFHEDVRVMVPLCRENEVLFSTRTECNEIVHNKLCSINCGAKMSPGESF